MSIEGCGKPRKAFFDLPAEVIPGPNGGRWVGLVTEWRGKCGWLVPESPMDHPAAHNQRGRVYLHERDAVDEVKVGNVVTFVAYADAGGMAATDCRQREDDSDCEEDIEHNRPQIDEEEWIDEPPQKRSRRGDHREVCSDKKRAVENKAGVSFRCRETLGCGRMRGCLVDWKGNFGWIRPDEHPKTEKLTIAGQANENLFVEFKDFDMDERQELPSAGARVSFVPFADRRGFIASHVRVLAKQMQEDNLPIAYKRPRCHRSAPRMFPIADRCQSTTTKSFMDASEHSARDLEDVKAKVYTALWKNLQCSIEAAAPRDDQWSEAEICKRIVRYLAKDAKAPEIYKSNWTVGVEQFIKTGMHRYIVACSSKPWFNDLDISEALFAGSWEIAQAISVPPVATQSKVRELVANMYEDMRDKVLIDSAIQEAVEEFFPDAEDAQPKLFQALSRAHEPAAAAALTGGLTLTPTRRLELFMKRWVEDSVGRAWCCIEAPEKVLREDRVARLFKRLAMPIDDDIDLFSCVPSVLLENENISTDWEFLRFIVHDLFQRWATPSPKTKKQKKKKKQNRRGNDTQLDDRPIGDDDVSAFGEKDELARVDKLQPDNESEEDDVLCMSGAQWQRCSRESSQ
eukprot:TRINITY_DN22692_c2_g1_i1.p1 TRINITY_DN22692_c2_g1~~TRINITY_DN22692_c2_g1_i1.p1  ORF type:complete len:628 (+),score=118.50 TRINITY_DN22692_c2_g1_i1:108-1991(+)